MTTSQVAPRATAALAAAAKGGAGRLAAIDSLRGVAALAVVVFHYTTQFMKLYGAADTPSLSFAWGGYLGVNLFFIISGFVIFMTLERTRSAMDFVVSRLSRLFPAYWAAVALTFAVVSFAGLPGKEVSAWHAVANLIMVHGLLNVPHVDSVYWSLEVEMLFYAAMLALFVSGQLRRVHVFLCLLLALRVFYDVSSKHFGVDLSWTLARLLNLTHLPWFALGICIYQATRAGGSGSRGAIGLTAALAIGTLAWIEGWVVASLAAALALWVWAAAGGRARWLENPLLAFFGLISYPLYLVHEHIGWVVQRAVLARGGSMDQGIAVAFVVVVVLAAMLTFGVERPAMRAIRARYAKRRS
ncbi:MAG: acyltransferase [Rubrivivax sp.]|nr:acyltransferase [Rubrivivax sp.]